MKAEAEMEMGIPGNSQWSKSIARVGNGNWDLQLEMRMGKNPELAFAQLEMGMGIPHSREFPVPQIHSHRNLLP